MHYLEDYLEIVEFLPGELKSRLLQIREFDDELHSQMESLNDRTKTFFALCRKNNKPEWREQQYQNLCQEYEKATKDSEEKTSLSAQVCDLLDRHMRRLDQDLSRFTIELEADTAGITEILEQRSYLLDRPPSPERPQIGQKRTRHVAHHEDLLNGDIDDYSPSPSARSSPAPTLGRYKYPRRERASTLNISAEPEADFLDLEEHLISPSSIYAGTGGKPPLAFAMDTKSHRKRSTVMPLVITETIQEPTDWMGYVDPNEPRYCLCNQVSYGEMVGCDNSECTIEWFHYGCVGITEPPKGKWYCPQCTISLKKKSSRKGL